MKKVGTWTNRNNVVFDVFIDSKSDTVHEILLDYNGEKVFYGAGFVCGELTNDKITANFCNGILKLL